MPAQSDIFVDESSGEPVISIGVLQVKYKDTTLSGVMFVNIKASLLSDAVAGIKINNEESSYACLLDSNGIYIYHPDASLIGTKTTDEIFLNVVERIQAGETPEPTVTLDEEGNYITYNVSALNHWILPISVAESMQGGADVANNNSDIVKLTRDTYQMAQATLGNAEALDAIIGKFQLDN